MTQTASDAKEKQQIHELSPDIDPAPETNGHHDENGDEHQRPSKRRRVSEKTTTPRIKPVSPPWKTAKAEGPSSFRTKDGLRKSGRVNPLPLELQAPSDKRQTRLAQRTYSTKNKNGLGNGSTSLLHGKDIPSSSTNGTKRAAPLSTTAQDAADTPTKAPSPKRSHRKSVPAEQTSVPPRPHRKKVGRPPTVHLRSPKLRRGGKAEETSEVIEPASSPLAHKTVEEPVGQSSASKPSKIKFRVKPATLPLLHPQLVLARPRQYETLSEFLLHGAQIPVEQGGLFHPDEASEYSPDQISKDAQILLRAEELAEPGGILSVGISSVYQPEQAEEIPPQYAHRDHMNRAALEFRRLMQLEAKKHRTTAKRLAEACRDEWYRRQPKTDEQLEAEKIKACQNRYRGLVRVLQSTWDNVRAEVNRRRLVEWEAQEQARVRKALSEAVDKSTKKLQARQVNMDSDMPSDEDEEEESDNASEKLGEGSNTDPEGSEDRDSNMSSTDSDGEDGELQPDSMDDEHLTVEQLREKYAALPPLPSAPSVTETGNGDDDSIRPDQDSDDESAGVADDSDESIDMDDDMGSSDEGSGTDNNSEEDGDDDEESNDENEFKSSDILGFLAPSELKSLDLGEVVPSPDVVMGEADLDEEKESVDNATNESKPDFIATSKPAVLPLIARQGSSENEELQRPIQGDSALISPDRSSQPTPRTTETRPSDVDSVSSIEPHHSSRHASHHVTPQPTSNLKTPIPSLLRGTLREYQHYGLDWLAGLYANNTNGILADEMGLGKTIQTIALLAHLACEHEVWGPHLVVVPTSVILNWEMEFKKWCPGFKILTYYGSQEERKKKRLGWRTEDAWNVCITSYQIVLADQAVFKRRQWHYMILDEAHNIKNFNSQRWQTMLTFNTRARLLITGTPLQNNLTELWSLLYFLMPSDGSGQGVGGFADLKEFQDWFKKPSEQILEHGRDQMDDESRGIITKLHKLLRPYLLRRLKADVEKQMPLKYEHVEFCRLSKRQRELYDGFLSRGDTRDTLASGNYLSIINCLMQLRKVCNHPDLFVERAIMTSFPMERSAIADFEIKELLVRRKLLKEDPMKKASLEFLNLVPAQHETLSAAVTSKSAALSAQRTLMDMRETQRLRAQNALTSLDPSTAKSNLVYLESASRWGRFEELQHCVYLNALRRQQKPIYGTQLVNLLTLNIHQYPLKPRPQRRKQLMTWLENSSPTLSSMIPDLTLRSQSLKTTIQKFACVTPPVITRDMNSLLLSPKGMNTVQRYVDPATVDPFHEARMRLSIQFPDKRLLQYDCGKLQTLAKLLRNLQAGGHRALIFTQMTKVLDILEQFLNIHGHKYLRLDGNTKIEQRQILTDRFNNDTRILAFILSSRSGGLGINLTGADTVIFYDLDWNPAMDAQCQDRCHRIGQTRDVHIYRLVSEHTIEANILRKANQKRMLDDVVIQEGEFNTDYFNRDIREVVGEESDLLDADAAANAAMDRVLGGPGNDKQVQRVLAQAEDQEDVAAAAVAEQEVVQTDAADFDELAATASATPAVPGTPRDTTSVPVDGGNKTTSLPEAMDIDEDEQNAWGDPIHSMDDYMLAFMFAQLKDTPVEIPKDKNKSKRGRDHRSHRPR